MRTNESASLYSHVELSGDQVIVHILYDSYQAYSITPPCRPSQVTQYVRQMQEATEVLDLPGLVDYMRDNEFKQVA